MNEFVEKNRGLLRFYCIAARTMGWTLIIVAPLLAIVGLFIGLPVIGLPSGERLRPWMLYRLSEQVILDLLLGLVMLGLAQFVRYSYENDCQPGWILRHGDKALYSYAAGVIVSPIVWYFFQMTIHSRDLTDTLWFFVSGELPALGRGLIYVGIGQVLRRMVPIIEESKTLV
ncbi:MAG: hypothetical protein JSU70_18680 [Phycisphaerales bacterium]|nr:MAG: hypothetical protein JSU70_18680 [Phycisphaerales bacterium]